MAATPHGRTGSVIAGRYIVEVGSDHGLALAPRDAPADDGAIRAAIERAEESPPPPRLEGALDSAAEVTTRCEEAADLVAAMLSGGILDPARAAARADVLAELVQRLDRDGRHEDALRLARVLLELLTLLQRWSELARTLHAGLRAAESLGDRAAEALFRHDLGTLELAAERLPQADDQLEAARELRARLGDRRGLAATERAQRMLCRRLREELHRPAASRPVAAGAGSRSRCPCSSSSSSPAWPSATPATTRRPAPTTPSRPRPRPRPRRRQRRPRRPARSSST